MSDELEKALARLNREYVESSDDRLTEIEQAIDRMYRGVGDRGADFVKMQRDIHSMKGSAGTYGFPAVSLILHRLEDFIEATRRLGNDDFLKLQIFLDRVREILTSGENPKEEITDDIVSSLPSSAVGVVSAQDVRKVTVLMVMPKGVQRKIVGKELASCGFELSFASSSIEAIDLAISIRPDIVVASLELDRISGATLARILETIDMTRGIPFVLTTSTDVERELDEDIPSRTRVVHKGPNFAEELSLALLDMGLFTGAQRRAG